MSRLRVRLSATAILMLAFLAFHPSVASAQAPVTDDAYVTQVNPATNSGGQTSLLLQAGAQPTYTYLKFDLSQVPAGSSVTKATLKLFVTAATTPGAFDIRLANGSWSETNLTWNNQPGGGPGSLMLGGSCASPIPATADPTHPLCVSNGQVNGYIVIDITSQVQAWINDPSSNYGIVIVPTSGYSTSVAFDSKESTSTSHDPTLNIVLTGAQGPAGPTGPQGPQGPQGVQGLKGDTGDAGLSFIDRGNFVLNNSYAGNDVVSYNGSSYVALQANNAATTPDVDATNWALFAAQGAAGPTGPQGVQGLKGDTGDAGATGPQGPQGVQGLKGDTGDTGATGPQGPQGPQGVQGLKGDTGDAGLSFIDRGNFVLNNSYAGNDVVSYNSSSYVALQANNAASTPDVDATNWALFAAQGAAGPTTGPQGPQGVQGLKGDTGDTGATGPRSAGSARCAGPERRHRRRRAEFHRPGQFRS